MSQGIVLTGNSGIVGVFNAVQNAMDNLGAPVSSDVVYLVLTHPDVTLDGFCSSYCGWHTYYTNGASTYKFGMIGGGLQCPGGCIWGASPNNDLQVRGEEAIEIVKACAVVLW